MIPQRADALVEHSTGIQYEIENRVTTPEVECTAGDDSAGTRHATHLCGNLIDIGYHIDREGRDAGDESGLSPQA